MQLPLAYLDAAVIEEVPINVWREVFDATGWPELLASKRSSFAYEDVLPALQDNPSDSLLYALETLHVLGTEGGREAIVSAMNDGRVPVDVLPANTGEREFALRLYLAQRNNASLADVFARAQIHVQEGCEQRRYNEFMGKEPRNVNKLDDRKNELHEVLLAHCRKSDLGEHVQVQAFEDDGAYVFNILRSDRTKKPLAVVPGRSARARLNIVQYMATSCDMRRSSDVCGSQRAPPLSWNFTVCGTGQGPV